MKQTRLKFSSAIYLIAFRRYSKASHWEIDLNALTVLCDCSKKEAFSACLEFGATIILQEENGENCVMREPVATPVRHKVAS